MQLEVFRLSSLNINAFSHDIRKGGLIGGGGLLLVMQIWQFSTWTFFMLSKVADSTTESVVTVVLFVDLFLHIFAPYVIYYLYSILKTVLTA